MEPCPPEGTAAGVELIELHHQRKAQQGVRREPWIDDVYGSTWITSGAGSVLLLTGAPGDPIIGMHHVKQPAEPVGPLRVIHDHATGGSSVWHAADLEALASGRPEGVTAVEAARHMFDTDKPSPNEKEKARRRLTALVDSGALTLSDPGSASEKRPAHWSAAGRITLVGGDE